MCGVPSSSEPQSPAPISASAQACSKHATPQTCSHEDEAVRAERHTGHPLKLTRTPRSHPTCFLVLHTEPRVFLLPLRRPAATVAVLAAAQEGAYLAPPCPSAPGGGQVLAAREPRRPHGLQPECGALRVCAGRARSESPSHERGHRPPSTCGRAAPVKRTADGFGRLPRSPRPPPPGVPSSLSPTVTPLRSCRINSLTFG